MSDSRAPTRLSRRQLLAGASLAALAASRPATAGARPLQVGAEWPVYGGTNAAMKYSPLSQIDRGNAGRLKIAWEWESPDAAVIKAHPELGLKPGEFQATPIMIGGVLYTSTAMSQVAAIDAATGKTLWVYDPQSWRRPKPTQKGFMHRGVAYWTDGRDARILIATLDNRLIALDARTGAKIATFGKDGEVDLAVVGLQRPLTIEPMDLFATTSAPTVCRDVVVVGQYISDPVVRKDMPPGDVRGFDVRTGALMWTFHTVPMKGEVGYETWDDNSADRNGNANIWAPMSADDELGLVYLPGSCATNNFYGGTRPGNDLFANCLIALDARTGRRRWHFQVVHHDVWDYDLPCAPALVDVTVGGKKIKAVAQATKHGFLFVFDRTTGKPVWPIEERPVPQSLIAGEHTSPTQPFPTKPAPFEPQGVNEADLIDFSPELRAQAKELLKDYEAGPLFQPYGHRPTISRPAWTGGANWEGVAVDPETGIIYVPSHSSLGAMALDAEGGRVAGPRETEEIAGSARVVSGPRGLPMFKPPYSRITAIDLKTGDHLWMKPNGPGATGSPALRPFNLGWIGSDQRAGPLLTKTLLFVGEGPHDPRWGRKVLRSYDKQTGDIVAEIALPGFPLGPPMTYLARGKQFIVCGMGIRSDPHKLVALSLA
ncbi:pyrroloquinoline quinone-dependent dehydrogenase [Phenylobacterium sp.]|jgi:quinoprotein glucose dehydrogenase|uniref:pyrroloquinoline quinone-dependent dehydrogenase n=1 Tax=Phenylobacterium sp. TaxID=1871053 RepID=UPI002E320B60|nr:pyrroloquinoline quinone-dependent dehydrogenase [Phenylobacterium sp.]HEX3367673.1 pyrroloquinoline quinone-dependent dehydrogenase [Phenylobacterium sp.]